MNIISYIFGVQNPYLGPLQHGFIWTTYPIMRTCYNVFHILLDCPTQLFTSQNPTTRELCSRSKQVTRQCKLKQDLVFSVKLHFGLSLYPLSLIPYALSLILYPLSLPLVPYPLVLFLSRNLGKGYCDCPKQK